MTAALLLVALAAAVPSHLQAVLGEYQASQDVPGISAVVVRQDEVLFSGASGVTDLETARPIGRLSLAARRLPVRRR